jgi:hypothetical protein
MMTLLRHLLFIWLARVRLFWYKRLDSALLAASICLEHLPPMVFVSVPERVVDTVMPCRQVSFIPAYGFALDDFLLAELMLSGYAQQSLGFFHGLLAMEVCFPERRAFVAGLWRELSYLFLVSVSHAIVCDAF